MALATTLTPLTSRPDSLRYGYEVALCVHAQGRNAGEPKTGYDAAGAAGGFGGVLGAFARSWRLHVACARKKEGWESTRCVWGY